MVAFNDTIAFDRLRHTAPLNKFPSYFNTGMFLYFVPSHYQTILTIRLFLYPFHDLTNLTNELISNYMATSIFSPTVLRIRGF